MPAPVFLTVSVCGTGIDTGFFMSLTLQDISRLARLARLDLDAEHSARMLVQLNGFFDTVDQMNAVDTTGVAPLAHPTAVIDHVALRLRDDVTSEAEPARSQSTQCPCR